MTHYEEGLYKCKQNFATMNPPARNNLFAKSLIQVITEAKSIPEYKVVEIRMLIVGRVYPAAVNYSLKNSAIKSILRIIPRLEGPRNQKESKRLDSRGLYWLEVALYSHPHPFPGAGSTISSS